MSDVTELHGIVAIPSPETGFTALGTEFVIRGTDLTKDNAFPQAKTVEVKWKGWTDEIAAVMVGRLIAGNINDGRYAIIEPSHVIEVVQGAEILTARFEINSIEIYDYRPPGHGFAAWVYRVLNLQMSSGDLLVRESHGDGSAAWRRNAIRFEYAEREWLLRDELRAHEDKELRDFQKQSSPILSGTLWTERREGDEPEAMDLLAMQVCNLLSLATERSVRWMSRQDVDATGDIRGGHRPSIWCAPASDGGNGPIDTVGSGSLAGFLNTAAAS